MLIHICYTSWVSCQPNSSQCQQEVTLAAASSVSDSIGSAGYGLEMAVGAGDFDDVESSPSIYGSPDCFSLLNRLWIFSLSRIYMPPLSPDAFACCMYELHVYSLCYTAMLLDSIAYDDLLRAFYLSCKVLHNLLLMCACIVSDAWLSCGIAKNGLGRFLGACPLFCLDVSVQVV